MMKKPIYSAPRCLMLGFNAQRMLCQSFYKSYCSNDSFDVDDKTYNELD